MIWLCFGRQFGIITPELSCRDARTALLHYSSLVMEKSLCVKTAKKNDRRDKSDSGERSTVDNSGCTWSLMSLKALVCATACGTIHDVLVLVSSTNQVSGHCKTPNLHFSYLYLSLVHSTRLDVAFWPYKVFLWTYPRPKLLFALNNKALIVVDPPGRGGTGGAYLVFSVHIMSCLFLRVPPIC